MMFRTILAVLTLLLVLPAGARAQFSIDWYTIDGGGGTSTGGSFSLSGTIGQHDAGTMAAGSFSIEGGFWGVGSTGGGGDCAADFNEDGQVNIFDFLAFQTAFGNEDPAADLAPPFGTFNLFDFLAFQTAFGNGC